MIIEIIIWSVLIDEIINIKHVCNIKINSIVSEFLNKNIDFTILKDKNNKIYEVPCVTYIGKETSKLISEALNDKKWEKFVIWILLLFYKF